MEGFRFKLGEVVSINPTRGPRSGVSGRVTAHIFCEDGTRAYHVIVMDHMHGLIRHTAEEALLCPVDEA